MLELEIAVPKEEFIKEKKKFKPVRFFGCLFIPVICLILGGYYLFKQYQQYALVNQSAIQVEIKSQIKKQTLQVPSSGSGDSFDHHPEAYVILPYDKTLYKQVNDNVHNLHFNYPSNTAAIVRNTDEDQIWILRKDAYMCNIQIIKTDEKLIDYYNARPNKALYTMTQTTFAKQKAFLLTQINQNINVRGNEYLISYKGNIYVIWYETYKPNENPDDEKRVQDILDSFVFL